jgi:hypothetical protein
MASIFDQAKAFIPAMQMGLQNIGIRQQQGETGHTGSWGLPEFGVTEMFKPTQVRAYEPPNNPPQNNPPQNNPPQNNPPP